MFQRKGRRFRRRTNGRNHSSHGNPQSRMRLSQFINGQSRGNFRPSLSAEKSFEKYTSLAKEAMSAGDKTLSENYLQHADHYMRIIEDKNRNRSDARVNSPEGSVEESKNLAGAENLNQKKEIKT